MKEIEVEEKLKEIGVSKEGIKIMIPKFIFELVTLHDINYGTANILKQSMLSIGGEVAVSKDTYNGSIKKTDVLIAGTLKQFEELKVKMLCNNLLELHTKIEERLK